MPDRNRITLCIDFDGTIVDHNYPYIGKPVPHAIAWLSVFQQLNYNLVLFTMRSGKELDEAVSYLKENNIHLYGINTNPRQKTWTDSPKAYGHHYIDDAAVGCPMHHPKDFNRPCVDWNKIGLILTGGTIKRDASETEH